MSSSVCLPSRCVLVPPLAPHGHRLARFAWSLRISLWREHLGLLRSSQDENLLDPVSDSVFDVSWKARAAGNADIFAQVFDNGMLWDQIQSMQVNLSKRDERVAA